jgi:hypothetical protein
MFSKTIIDSDAFLEMPTTSQLLYFHLGLRADDEGFVNKPKSIMQMVGCKEDDIRVLIAKNFIIPFESGVVVIKHWRIHNWIRKERIQETKYTDERAQLSVKGNGSYTLNVRQMSDTCQTDVRQVAAEVSIGKDSIGEVSNIGGTRSRFVPPTLDQVTYYCKERKNSVDPQRFIDFYEARGWMIGKNKMKDWKAAVRTWESRDKADQPPAPLPSKPKSGHFKTVPGAYGVPEEIWVEDAEC